jgi:DNA polymerase I-like protein with 3'-5' exonuclease and polymerase domains
LRQAVNFKIQNLAAEMMLLTLRELHRERLMVVGTIHDSVLVECDPQEAEAQAALVKQVMEQRVPDIMRSEFGVDLDVPIVADVTTGQYWA